MTQISMFTAMHLLYSMQEDEKAMFLSVEMKEGSPKTISVTKDDYQRSFASVEHLEEWLKEQILEYCDEVDNDPIAITRASFDIASRTRRGAGSMVGNVLIYSSRNNADGPIIVKNDDGVWWVYLVPNWTDYIRVIK